MSLYVLGVDPGQTGGAALVEHYDDGRRVLHHLAPWSTTCKPRLDGLPSGTKLSLDNGGATACIEAAAEMAATTCGHPCIVRVESAWTAGAGRKAIASEAITAGCWLPCASPFSAHTFYSPSEWRKHYGWAGLGTVDAKGAAEAWCIENVPMSDEDREQLTPDTAEALCLAWMPVVEG